ncbi:MAG: thioesterase [Propionibacteriales bacterium]|nr:thioesterase [Propionibacteriales bacterium]
MTVGMTAAARHEVTAADTADSLGSGDLAVLGTSRLLAWAEAVTYEVIATALEDTETSVGTRVQIEHLRPSPLDATVTVTATVAHVDGRLVRCQVAAEHPDGTLVGHGEVTRVIVNRERFLSRLG